MGPSIGLKVYDHLPALEYGMRDINIHPCHRKRIGQIEPDLLGEGRNIAHSILGCIVFLPLLRMGCLLDLYLEWGSVTISERDGDAHTWVWKWISRGPVYGLACP